MHHTPTYLFVMDAIDHVSFCEYLRFSRNEACFEQYQVRQWNRLSRVSQIRRLGQLPLPWLAALINDPAWGLRARRELHRRVQAILSEWGLGLDETLAMFHAHNCVMMGPVVVGLIIPESEPSKALALACPLDGLQGPLAYLKLEGYDVDPDEEEGIRWGGGPGVMRTVSLRHRASGRQIDLTESVSTSPLVPLLFSPTTTLMNVVMSDGVVCMYPRQAIMKNGMESSIMDISERTESQFVRAGQSLDPLNRSTNPGGLAALE